MESKAQRAAFADIVAHILSPHNIYAKDPRENYDLQNICQIIEEYNLEKDSLNEIYEALMKFDRHGDAASLAKKYGL